MDPCLLSMAKQPVLCHPETHHGHQYPWLLLQYHIMHAWNCELCQTVDWDRSDSWLVQHQGEMHPAGQWLLHMQWVLQPKVLPAQKCTRTRSCQAASGCNAAMQCCINGSAAIQKHFTKTGAAQALPLLQVCPAMVRSVPAIPNQVRGGAPDAAAAAALADLLLVQRLACPLGNLPVTHVPAQAEPFHRMHKLWLANRGLACFRNKCHALQTVPVEPWFQCSVAVAAFAHHIAYSAVTPPKVKNSGIKISHAKA